MINMNNAVLFQRNTEINRDFTKGPKNGNSGDRKKFPPLNFKLTYWRQCLSVMLHVRLQNTLYPKVFKADSVLHPQCVTISYAACYNHSVLLYVVSNIVAHSMYATCPLDMMCADTINFSDTAGGIKISFLRLEPETFGYSDKKRYRCTLHFDIPLHTALQS